MPPEQWQQNNFKTGMDSPNTKISNGNWFLIVVCKFIAERIITCQCTNENLGNSLTKRDFRLQSGNLVYKMRFSFTKRDSWVTNGTLALHFTIFNVTFITITTNLSRCDKKLLQNWKLCSTISLPVSEKYEKINT